jgi:hypothetical protein
MINQFFKKYINFLVFFLVRHRLDLWPWWGKKNFQRKKEYYGKKFENLVSGSIGNLNNIIEKI